MNDITKLPKWAQEHIHNTQRQRDIAVRALDEYTDNQTPSPVSVQEMECVEHGSPKFYTRYVQTNKITINHSGVELRVLLRNGHIDLSYGGGGLSTDEVALIPASFQQIRLVSKENMRV